MSMSTHCVYCITCSHDLRCLCLHIVCIVLLGMAWLATLYETDEERGEAIGTAMTGLGLGVLGRLTGLRLVWDWVF